MKSDIDKFIVHLYAMFSPNQINESKTKIHVTKFMNNHGYPFYRQYKDNRRSQ